MGEGLVAQLKERYTILDMVELLGLAEGRRGVKVLCPFHADTNPSLHLFVDDDRWRCFVCDIGGDQLDLYAQAKDLPLALAIKQLADEAGLDWNVEWKPLKDRPPAPAELLGRVAAKAHLEVLRQLTRDYPEARGRESWVPLVDHVFTEYDEIMRRYRNTELKPEVATEMLLIWWKRQTGGAVPAIDLRQYWSILGDPRFDGSPEPRRRQNLTPRRT